MAGSIRRQEGEHYQIQVTLNVLKVGFSLSAFPFIFFQIGPLQKLMTSTVPTAYNRAGVCVHADPHGLSSLCVFLRCATVPLSIPLHPRDWSFQPSP